MTALHTVVITGASRGLGSAAASELYRRGWRVVGATVYRDESGPYGLQHPQMEKRGRVAVRMASPPERFARSLARALEHDRQPIVHRGAGIDAKIYRTVARVMPTGAMHHMIRIGLGQPKYGALNGHGRNE